MDSENKGGRPLKFPNVGELEIAINEYFGDCDPHIGKRTIMKEKANGEVYVGKEEYVTEQKPYTITGLALALGTTRRTLLDYQQEDEFSHTITRAKLRCEQYAEQHLFTGKTPAGAVFNLKNNYGWKDESTVFNPAAVVADLDALEKLNAQKEEVGDEAQKALDAAPGSEA